MGRGSVRPVRFTSRDGRVVVEQSREHPEQQVFIVIDGHKYFLCIRVPMMTERDLRAEANAFLKTRPHLWP